MCVNFVTQLAPATGYTKFGILYEDVEFARPLVAFLEKCLPSPSAATGGQIPVEKGVEVVGIEKHLPDATDFSSQFGALEAPARSSSSRSTPARRASRWPSSGARCSPKFALGGINVAGQANGYFEATGGGRPTS
jgi:hypothetical protein